MVNCPFAMFDFQRISLWGWSCANMTKFIRSSVGTLLPFSDCLDCQYFFRSVNLHSLTKPSASRRSRNHSRSSWTARFFGRLQGLILQRSKCMKMTLDRWKKYRWIWWFSAGFQLCFQLCFYVWCPDVPDVGWSQVMSVTNPAATSMVKNFQWFPLSVDVETSWNQSMESFIEVPISDFSGPEIFMRCSGLWSTWGDPWWWCEELRWDQNVPVGPSAIPQLNWRFLLVLKRRSIGAPVVEGQRERCHCSVTWCLRRPEVPVPAIELIDQ